ncbi:metallophosphoesterase [Novosphingobium sp.]|uniref:metallophosphoesterase n=1 Tax=Novosphingobium sp. TaxID=1874826 RepID=UPI0028B0208F|nr:metallophosphoesterase [Novosphingobium sp.]
MALPVRQKVALSLLLLGSSQFHFWNELSSGSVFAPEFPRFVVILFNWSFIAIVLLAVLQLASDLVTLLATPWRRTFAQHGKLRPALAGLAMLFAAIGVWNATRVPAVKDTTVEIRDLPPAFDGYRIVQLTDLHISRLFPARWATEVVRRTNATNADLIVVTGDFIDGSVAMRRADVAPLAALRARDGVFGIPGNHEYYFDYRNWMRHLAGLGIRLLPNSHMLITRGTAHLVLAGVTDLSAPEHGLPGPDLDAALKDAPIGSPVILLDHQPKFAAKAAAKGIALQLSGHTHGGMIVGLDRIIARSNAGYVSGRYRVGAMDLYVSNGTALWPGFAVRLGKPPEITCITLRSMQATSTGDNR